MGSFGRLLRRLHSVFRKDADAEAVVRIHASRPYLISCEVSDNDIKFVPGGMVTCGSGRRVGDGITSGRIGQVVAVSFGGGQSDLTVEGLVSVLNGQGGLRAELLRPEFAPRLARGIMDRPSALIAADNILWYPTSLLWAELEAYAWALDDQAMRLAVAEEQAYPTQASGEWLDEWGHRYFGIPRERGESDDEYRIRFRNEILRPVANNRALELIVEDALGVGADIADAAAFAGHDPANLTYGAGWFYGTPGVRYGEHPFFPGLPDDLYGQLLVGLRVDATLPPEKVGELRQRAREIVERYKAAGTRILESITFNQFERSAFGLREDMAIEVDGAFEDTLLARAPTYGLVGLVYGTEDIVYGMSGLREAIHVLVIDATDDSTVEEYRL